MERRGRVEERGNELRNRHQVQVNLSEMLLQGGSRATGENQAAEEEQRAKWKEEQRWGSPDRLSQPHNCAKE